MHWKIENKQTTPKHKKEAIRRSVSVKMPMTDIAYFLGIPNYVVSNNIKLLELNNKRPEVPNRIKSFKIGKGKCPLGLNYRLASEIYEGRDKCKFNRDEIAEVLDTKKEIVDYAFENEDKIRKDIIEAFRILYKDNKINAPYKRNF